MNVRWLLPWVAAVLVFGLPPVVDAATVSLKLHAEAGRWTAARLRNLPAGTLVLVEMHATAEITAAFVDREGFQRLPRLDRALFRGSNASRLSFSVTTRTGGDHFLVLDNRMSTEARDVEVRIHATREGREGTAEVTLTAFQDSLARLFVLDPVPIRMKRCGKPNAFAEPAGIVVCAEYVELLTAKLGSSEKASDALLFTLFHELGHVLLAQWRYPFFANEEVADEFATALMVMLGQRARVRAKAEFFAANPAVAEAIAKAFHDDRHPLSVQRARNIMRWVNDRNLVRKWLPIFVPHLQTAVLERLLQRAPDWLDRPLVERELSSRRRPPER